MINLMKYEIIRSYKWYLMMFVIYLLSCALVPYLPNGYIKNVGIDIVMLEMVVLLLAIFLISVIQFYRTMFTKQAYFTLTLPYKYTTIVCAKITVAAIWVILGFAVLAAGVWILSITYLQNLGLNDFFYNLVINFIQFMFSLFNSEFWLKAVFAVMIELVQFLIIMLLIITAVQTRLTRKYRILIAIIIFVVLTALSIILVSNLSLGSLLAMSIDYYWINLVISILISFVAYYLIIYILKHSIELE